MQQEQVSAKFAEIQSKGLETAFSLSEAALENAQKLAELNYDASKNILLDAQESFQQVITAKDPKDVSEFFKSDVLQDASAKAIDHQKKITKLLRDSNKELVNVVDSSIEQAQTSVQDWIDTVSANAPAGFDVYVSAFKTSYNAALQGFEQFRETTKEAIATVEKSADQAIDAVQGQFEQVKKAPRARKVVAA